MSKLNKKHVATLAATEYIVATTIKSAMKTHLTEVDDTFDIDKVVCDTVRARLKCAGNTIMPVCEFKPTNVLYEEVMRICGLGDIMSATETDEERIIRWRNETSDIARNDIFKAVATSMATKLSGANDIIRDMKNNITELSSRITAKTQEYIAADAFLHQHCDCGPVEIVYDEFPFKALDLVGSLDNLKDYIYAEMNIAKPDTASAVQYNLVMEKFAASKLKDERCADVVMSPEDRDAVVKAVNEKHKDFLNSTIRATLNMLLSKKSLITAKNRIMNAYKRTETTEACMVLLGMIHDIRGIASEISHAVAAMDLPDAVSAIDANIAFTDDCTDLCAFYVNWHRENTFKNTVFMRNKTLNPDMLAKCKEAGVVNLDIARHCNKVFGQSQLPTTGVSLSAVLAQKESIAKRVEREDAQIGIRVQAGKIEKERYAFSHIVYMWLEGQDGPDIPRGQALSEYVKLKSSYMATKNMSTEDVLYDITVALFHRGTFVHTLYTKLGAEYHKLVASNPNITVGDIAMTNVTTYAEILTEFLSETFMVA